MQIEESSHSIEILSPNVNVLFSHQGVRKHIKVVVANKPEAKNGSVFFK